MWVKEVDTESESESRSESDKGQEKVDDKKKRLDPPAAALRILIYLKKMLKQ